MAKLVNRTVDALARFGEKIEQKLSIDESDTTDDVFIERSGSSSMFPSRHSAFHRPLDKQADRKYNYASERRGSGYGKQRKPSYDHLAASPAHGSFQNYRQNPSGRRGMVDGAATTTQGFNPAAFYGGGGGYPMMSPAGGGYGSGFSTVPFSSGMAPGYANTGGYGAGGGSVGYAPDYYIAERRQVELVPAPPPRVIQQPVPYPVAVDRPVPQPYPVRVPHAVPVDRPVPVPVPVPTPVPVDRPFAVPVPVPVPSPPPPPVCIPVPVPVPSPVPCYIPVGVPVPSPPPSPVMFEQSVTHSQRWITGTPGVVNQVNYVSPSPAMGNYGSFGPYGNASFIR